MTPIAVVDVETTGLSPYRHDRIVEVAIALVDPIRGILSELQTVVNPERDIGPSSIHGLTATIVINAPRFDEIAEHLAGAITGCCALAGHNIRFDESFLRAEFGRIGVELPHYRTLDTMALSGGGTLSDCCRIQGVSFEGTAHAAGDDTRATAQLLLALLSENPELLRECETYTPPAWPAVPPATRSLITRTALQEAEDAVPRYVQKLADSLAESAGAELQSGGERIYRALLTRVLADGRVDPDEGDALVDAAMNWGLTFNSVERIHLEFLSRLVGEAWVDRRLSDAEHSEIQVTAQLLGFGKLTEEQIKDLVVSGERDMQTNGLRPERGHLQGMTVCFTGECACSIEGERIARNRAERIATDNGLRVVSTVTKRLDILVVADPNTQSGKAKKARKYRVRIVPEPRFWRELGVDVD
jgi:DNA polymerase-3 subunit epsilon